MHIFKQLHKLLANYINFDIGFTVSLMKYRQIMTCQLEEPLNIHSNLKVPAILFYGYGCNLLTHLFINHLCWDFLSLINVLSATSVQKETEV